MLIYEVKVGYSAPLYKENLVHILLYTWKRSVTAVLILLAGSYPPEISNVEPDVQQVKVFGLTV